MAKENKPWTAGRLVTIDGQLFRIVRKKKFTVFSDHKCLSCLAKKRGINVTVCVKCLQNCPYDCYPVLFQEAQAARARLLQSK